MSWPLASKKVVGVNKIWGLKDTWQSLPYFCLKFVIKLIVARFCAAGFILTKMEKTLNLAAKYWILELEKGTFPVNLNTLTFFRSKKAERLNKLFGFQRSKFYLKFIDSFLRSIFLKLFEAQWLPRHWPELKEYVQQKCCTEEPKNWSCSRFRVLGQRIVETKWVQR